MSFTSRRVLISTRRTFASRSDGAGIGLMVDRWWLMGGILMGGWFDRSTINHQPSTFPLRHGNVIENGFHDRIGGLPLRLRLVAEDDAVPEDVVADGFDVAGGDVAAALQERPSLRGQG